MPSAKDFFSSAEKEAIVHAIEKAETATSGEIKIHLEDRVKGNILDHALAAFQKLGMHNTALRNGVLIFVAVRDRQFAILADEGIHQKVPENFWDTVKEEMQGFFAQEKFSEGIIKGIEKAGAQLQQYFPVSNDDRNELSNDISY